MGQNNQRATADQDALLRVVYRDQLPRVYGYLAYRLGGRRALAEELTQDVFLAYVAAIRSCQDVRDAQGWLITVARNKLVAHLRRAEHHTDAVLEPVMWDELARTEAQRNAFALLESLPPDQRAAMTLRYIDDLAVRDVAELMDRTVAATESLLARARRALQESS